MEPACVSIVPGRTYAHDRLLALSKITQLRIETGISQMVRAMGLVLYKSGARSSITRVIPCVISRSGDDAASGCVNNAPFDPGEGDNWIYYLLCYPPPLVL